MAAIRVGIGGWTFEPWRGVFYPPKWPQKRELEYASRHVTAIEINGTFYSRFKPASFAGWRDTAPDGFVFAVKGSRYCTNRRVLAEAGEAVERFVDQGIVELGDKLGPILWQLAATKRFDADDVAAFLALLPSSHAGVPLRHAIEATHESFRSPAFIDLARNAGVTIAHVTGAAAKALEEQTGSFSYARLKDAREELDQGFAPDVLDRWTDTAKRWHDGGARDVFVLAINGAKVRAPAAAAALIERL